MAKTSTRSGVLLVVVMMTLSAAVASAKKNEVKDRINHAVDDATKAIKATKQQKQQVKAAMQEVVTASVESVGPKMGTLPELEPLLHLFVQPTLDVAAMDKIRTDRDEKDGKVATALVHAFLGIHAALDHAARERLMAYETKRNAGKALSGFKKTLLVGVAKAYIDQILDEIGCSEDEKAAARVVRDHLFDAAFDAYGDPDAQYATVGGIFVPDEVDQPALDRFRDERESKVKALTQAIEQALVDLHAALTPEHRVHLAQIIHDRTTERAGAAHLGADAFQ
jgi:Spy/CpxP family protein refolding chaperone